MKNVVEGRSRIPRTDVDGQRRLRSGMETECGGNGGFSHAAFAEDQGERRGQGRPLGTNELNWRCRRDSGLSSEWLTGEDVSGKVAETVEAKHRSSGIFRHVQFGAAKLLPQQSTSRFRGLGSPTAESAARVSSDNTVQNDGVHLQRRREIVQDFTTP